MKTIKEMVVGINSAPRTMPTLPTCLDTILRNGWVPYVYAEPETDIEKTLCLLPEDHVIVRPYRYGTFFNWLSMAIDLIDKNPNADAIMTVQDDSKFTIGIKDFVETDVWPSPTVGFVSLYTPKHYQYNYVIYDEEEKIINAHTNEYNAKKDARKYKNVKIVKELKPNGCNRISTRSLWGACALIFPTEILKQVVTHRKTREWRGVRSKTRTNSREDWEVANVDTLIGGVINDLGKTMWFYQPSFVTHISKFSTSGHGDNTGRRNADYYMGEFFDPDQFKDMPQRFLSPTQHKPIGDQEYDGALCSWLQNRQSITFCIGYKCWNEIRKVLTERPNAKVLECGSGLSSLLIERYTPNLTVLEDDFFTYLLMLSLIENKESLHKVNIDDCWYNWQPDTIYDLVFIDGPFAGNGCDRRKFMRVADKCIGDDTIIIVDDSHREEEAGLVKNIVNNFGFMAEHFIEQNREFDVIRKWCEQ